MTKRVVSVDADGHVIEPMDMWRKYLPAKLRERGPTRNGSIILLDGIPTNRADRTSHMEGGSGYQNEPRYHDFVRRGFDGGTQIEAMNNEGIDIAVLFPSIGLMLMGASGVDPQVTTAIATAYNDWLADFCRSDTKRLIGVGMIDPRDPDGAVLEAKRCVEKLGFSGVFMRPNPVNGLPLYSSAYSKLWSTIEELDIPLCFHEGSAVQLPQSGVDRFDKHALWHVCSHPMEQQLALVAMVLGGVLESHPRLRAAFLECGASWLPYFMWRMDEAFEKDGHRDTPYLSMKPSDYVRRQCFVSIDSDEEPGVFAIREMNNKNVVWGSDYPHPDAKYPESLRTVSSLHGMTPEMAAAVLSVNPCALYGAKVREAVQHLSKD